MCLSGGVILEAVDGMGRIDLRGARGGVVDDGTTTFRGQVLGTVTVGDCP